MEASPVIGVLVVVNSSIIVEGYRSVATIAYLYVHLVPRVGLEPAAISLEGIV